MPGHMRFRDDIQGLRAVAVLVVILCHARVPGFTGGYVGVDIFFVISGFLISSKILSPDFTYRGFYVARARRILPALSATIVLSLITGSLLLSPIALAELARESAWALIGLSNVYFWRMGDYFAAEFRPLLHTWSLGVEEQFYLLWPLLLLRTGRFVWIVAAGSFALAMLWSDPTAVFYLTPFRAFEFALGGILAAHRLPQRAWFGPAGLVLIAATVFFATPSPSIVPGTIGSLGAVLCIQAGTARLLTYPAMIGLGRISYSLYLVHWPVLSFHEYAVGRPSNAVETACLLGLILAMAVGMFRVVEEPFRKRIGLRRSLVANAVALAVAVSAWGGWAWRSPLPSTAEGLHAEHYGGVGCPLPRCETQPGRPVAAYVIGDSHAVGLYAGLRLVFPELNFVIYGTGACSMFTDRIFHRNPGQELCERARQQAFEEIRRSPAPTILFQYWQTRFTRPSFAPEPVTFKNESDFAEIVFQELRRLRIPVAAIIGGVPQFYAGSSPNDCATRPFPLGDCAQSSRSHEVVQAHVRLNLALKGRGLLVIDPYDALCSAEACVNFDPQGRPLYSDRHHLSTWGSGFLVSLLRPTISEVVSNAPHASGRTDRQD